MNKPTFIYRDGMIADKEYVVFNQLSHDMRAMFQEETGFSAANLRYMKRWYAFYLEHAAKSQRAVDKSASQLLQRPVEEILKEWEDEV